MASGPITSWEIDGETVSDFILGGFKITADSDCSHEIKRHLLLGRKVMTNLDSIFKSRDITNKCPSSQGYGFSSGHVWIWELDCKESWAPRIHAFELWCWRRLLRVPWTARRANPKGDQSWVFIGRTDIEAETPILWSPDAKDPDAGKDWRQEEKKGMTEDEMVGWHHQLNGHDFEETQGDSDGQRCLVCCSPRGRKESDMTEWLKWTELERRRCHAVLWLTAFNVERDYLKSIITNLISKENTYTSLRLRS